MPRMYFNESYSSSYEARSVAGFLIYFGDVANALLVEGTHTPENGAITCDSVIMDVIVSSADELEYGAGFIAA